MANVIYIWEGTGKVTVTCIVLPVSGIHSGYWRQAFHKAIFTSTCS